MILSVQAKNVFKKRFLTNSAKGDN
jgi:hypothetical protein